MIVNRESNVINPPHANEALIKLVIRSVMCFFLLMVLSRILTHYTSEPGGTEFILGNETDSQIENVVGSEPAVKSIEDDGKVQRKVAIRITKMPSCPKSYLLVILEEICADLIVKKELCTPEDFYNRNKHKIPRTRGKNQSNIDPKVPAIINYAVGGLLIMSVGAALLELYKAKKQSPKKDGKNPLSRKCSLADLTVLKHHRKELIRRESIMEIPEDSNHLKQLGFTPPPLNRRCSFPVGPHPVAANYGPNQDYRISTESIRKLSVVDSRRTSIVDSRRTSLDCWNISIDERRISVDDSPERRHHRLVHRH